MITIRVDNEEYEKIMNGEPIEFAIESEGKDKIVAKLTVTKPKKKPAKKKKTESTGWDNPPHFNSLEERDLWYK